MSRVYTIRCDGCGREESEVVGEWQDDWFSEGLEDSGWRLSRRRRNAFDLCPDCIKVNKRYREAVGVGSI